MASRSPSPRLHIPFFRIFYSTTYTSLFFILLVVLAITPASLIYSSVAASAYQYVFVVGAAYVAVTILTLFIYSSRLYSNRSTIAGVGKSYIPINEDEVGKKVRNEIVRGLRHSRMIAAEIRPRTCQTPAPWATIEQPGWSAPRADASDPTSHIYYGAVVAELCNLLEARIASQLDPKLDPDEYRRRHAQGLRDYLSDLDRRRLVLFPPVTDRFVERYERARFSSAPLNRAEFDQLMDDFARVLSELRPLL